MNHFHSERNNDCACKGAPAHVRGTSVTATAPGMYANVYEVPTLWNREWHRVWNAQDQPLGIPGPITLHETDVAKNDRGVHLHTLGNERWGYNCGELKPVGCFSGMTERDLSTMHPRMRPLLLRAIEIWRQVNLRCQYDRGVGPVSEEFRSHRKKEAKGGGFPRPSTRPFSFLQRVAKLPTTVV